VRSSDQLQDDLRLALAAVRAAEEPILKYFRSDDIGLVHKGDGSPVTLADKAAEAAIREVLLAGSPEIDILGEEEDSLDRGRRYRWVIDPIDGTISFSRGIPLFGTLLALEDRQEDRPLLGIINLPALGETYFGGPDMGTWCGQQELTISDNPASDGPAHAAEIIAAGDPLWFDQAGVGDDYAVLVRHHRLLRGYTDCFGHAMVLRGGVGAVVDPGLSLWDFAASRALVEGAGGSVWMRPSQLEGSTDLILGKPRLVEQLRAELGW
jgi:histidinol phosphatase-like enzyme (inositol monophosphatase family)